MTERPDGEDSPTRRETLEYTGVATFAIPWWAHELLSNFAPGDDDGDDDDDDDDGGNGGEDPDPDPEPDYDVVEVPAGEKKKIFVESGETYENVLFDITADGAGVVFDAKGTDWTIRNIGFKGEFDVEDTGFGIADTGGGTSRIENVYMGDGTADPYDQRTPSFGMWVSPAHDGHLVIDRVNVQDANDNAFYCSAPGSNGNGQLGTVHLKNCYAKDNWVSCFRISRGTVENCVGVNTNDGRNGRPLWVWPTDRHGDTVKVIDCDFIAGPYPYSAVLGAGDNTRTVDVHFDGVECEGTIQRNSSDLNWNGEYGKNAKDRVPEGCPTSPEEAAEGD